MRDLSEIEAFVQVIRAGGFLPAERVTGVPKSTLSRKVAMLEDRLGTSLVKRTTRQLKLTDAGQVYFRGCADALQEIDRVEQLAVDSQSKPRGLIRMTAPVEVASDILPEIISDFKNQNPEIEFEIDLSDRIVDLVGEDFDIALRAGALDDSSSLIAKKVGVGGFSLFASPAYAKEAVSKIKNPKDLSNFQCIYHYIDPGPPEWDLRKNDERVTVKINSCIRVNSLLMAKNLAIAGAGIALIPSFMCNSENMTGELVPVLPHWEAFYGAFYLVTPKKKYTPPRVKLFSEYLAKKLREKFV